MFDVRPRGADAPPRRSSRPDRATRERRIEASLGRWVCSGGLSALRLPGPVGDRTDRGDVQFNRFSWADGDRLAVVKEFEMIVRRVLDGVSDALPGDQDAQFAAAPADRERQSGQGFG